jgi:hypothetical protein
MNIFCVEGDLFISIFSVGFGFELWAYLQQETIFFGTARARYVVAWQRKLSLSHATGTREPCLRHAASVVGARIDFFRRSLSVFLFRLALGT